MMMIIISKLAISKVTLSHRIFWTSVYLPWPAKLAIETIPEALKLQEASNELNTSLTFLSLSFVASTRSLTQREKEDQEERREE